MRFILGPVLSLVLLISSLGLLANAYIDHDEFIARSTVDGLSMRGESLAVPFQHSLREFLEGAVDVYKRSLDEYEDGILEARAREVTISIRVGVNGKYEHLTRFKVQSNLGLRALAGMVPKEVIEPQGALYFTAIKNKKGDEQILKMGGTIDSNGLVGMHPNDWIYLAAYPLEQPQGAGKGKKPAKK
ncbi:hypothetical protein DFP72DRAFT_1066900 [Ephemerocybe angulata]|uniref:Uncharacterized protein n=1 Tax=Ephemerocybe angulata TaxID=980116 RepID=A0A8H6I2A5_9AGAR|nr:hypothetical protein DFP72DRAFT_1066900 [Tulosesus angulatus]